MKTIKNWDNKEIEMKKSDRNISELFFNPYNTRHEANLAKLRSTVEMGEVDHFSDEFQNEIFELFKKDSQKNKKNLRDSIKNIGKIVEPLVITEDNIVLSGNNRLSILKDFKNKGESKIEYDVPVLIYPATNLSEKEIDFLETVLQHRGKEFVPYKSYERALKIFKHIRVNKYSPEYVANMFSMKIEEIKNDVNTIEAYFDYLTSMRNRKYTTLFQELDVYSVVEYMGKDTFKKIPATQRNILAEMYYSTTLTKMPFNSLRTASNNVLKSSIPTEQKTSILKWMNDEIKNEFKETIDFGKELIVNHEEIKNNDDFELMLKKHKPKLFVADLTSKSAEKISNFKGPDSELKSTLERVKKDLMKLDLSKVELKDEIGEKIDEIKSILQIKWEELK